MSDIKRSEASRNLLERLSVPAYSRQVLLKTLFKNAEAETPSGILKIGDTDWDEAGHADRVAEVVAAPKRLPFEVKKDLTPWETTVEISPGMTVWFDFLDGLNCDVFNDEDGAEYKLVDYDALYVATLPRFEGECFGLQESEDGKEYIIPLNGFHLFETVNVKRKSQFDISPDRVDPRYGVVAYVAQNNTAYENGLSEDHVKLRVGDLVRFGKVPPVMLEDELHCVFDGGKMYRRAQARNVEMVWTPTGQMILPKGRVLVKEKLEETIRPSGIIMLKPETNFRTGEVKVSSNDEVMIGSDIIYSKGSGQVIEYKGEECRIIMSEQILYVK